MIMDETFCKDCELWLFARKIDKDSERRFGECYRFPPELTLGTIDMPRPMTAELTHSCGEFKAKK